MFHDFQYPAILAASTRAAWQIDDVIGPGATLDFSKPFMPENLARTAELDFLSGEERMALNHIRAHEYLCMFGVVEEFILPFLLDHARPHLLEDDWRVRALLNFASEEAKHIHLFKRFHAAFVRGFPVEVQMIGPSKAIGEKILSHDPLAVGLVILMIEWMTQQHYLGSIKDNGDLDPLFKSLLKNHWIEESQHAKLDTLIVDALAEGRSEAEIDKAIDDVFAIAEFLDGGLKAQAAFNLDALEEVIGRKLENRAEIEAQQHQAARWTFIGSGLVHERFKATVQNISSKAAARIAEAAPIFA